MKRPPGQPRALLAVTVLASLASAGGAAAAAPSAAAAFRQQFRALAPLDKVEAHELLVERHVIDQLADAVAQGDASEATHARQQSAEQRLRTLLPGLQEAGGLAPALQLAAEELADELSRARAPSRLARALTLVNLCWFVGCVLVVMAAAALVAQYLVTMVLLVPLLAWEALGYCATAALLRWATHSASPGAAPYLGLTALLLFTACTGGTAFLHFGPWLERWKHSAAAASASMAFYALAYGAVAVRLQSSMLGTLAVWWLVSALGFSVAVFPGLTVIGFRGGMAQPFAASLALILAFLPFKAAPASLPTPAFLRPFETGVWLWCTLVLNVANLILGHEGWRRCSHSSSQAPPMEVLVQLPWRVRLRFLTRVAVQYLGAQLPPLAVVAGTQACGVLLDVEQCRAVGAVFGFLWLASQLAQINWARVGIAWAALAVGTVLWSLAYAVHARPAVFTYLLGGTAAGNGK